MPPPKIFLEDKIQQLKLRLEDSEKKLLAFAQEQQIVASEGDKASIAESNLAAANAELGTLISERTKNEQLWQQLEGTDAINLPQLLTNPVIEILAQPAQGAHARLPGEARDVQAGVSRDGRDQQ